MKAKQANRLLEQKNFSSHCRIYQFRNWVILLLLLIGLAGFFAYTTGVNMIYVVLGMWLAKAMLRMLFTMLSLICRVLVLAIIILLLFSILIH